MSNKFIFNATKRSMSPQKTRYGNDKLDRWGAPLQSIQVIFDKPEMKTEAIRRMVLLAKLYSTDWDIFPEELQSGSDPKPKDIDSVMDDMLVQSLLWEAKPGNHIFESFITRHNDILDYIKVHFNDHHLQTLEDDYAIRITPRRKVKTPPKTNLDDLIK